LVDSLHELGHPEPGLGAELHDGRVTRKMEPVLGVAESFFLLLSGHQIDFVEPDHNGATALGRNS
jgi:hypothetical protein